MAIHGFYFLLQYFFFMSFNSFKWFLQCCIRFWGHFGKKERKATYQVSSCSSANWGYHELKVTINTNQIECSHHCAIHYLKKKRVSFFILPFWTEFITKALKSRRPQNGTQHYQLIQRVNVWTKGPLLEWHVGGPTNGLHHPPPPSPPTQKITGTLQFNTTQLSAFCFCVTRTTVNPVYADGASSSAEK